MPFSVQEFFDVFEAYNVATAPASVVLLVLAAIAIMALAWRTPWSARIILLILATFWAWSGTMYHLAFFTGVNPAAWVFGGAFITEAVLLLWLAFRPADRPSGGSRPGAKIASGMLVVYALILYPVLTSAAGHPYPQSPSFGTPCPVTIFTLGMLTAIGSPWYTAAIPIGWSIVGSSAAIYFGVYADLGLLAAAFAFLLLRLAAHSGDPGRARRHSL